VGRRCCAEIAILQPLNVSWLLNILTGESLVRYRVHADLGFIMPKKPTAENQTSVVRKRRKEDRPREIVAAATEVFRQQGFAAARLEDVARQAGVSKGTLFVYFKDKEDLFRAVARSVLDRHPGNMTSLALDTNRPLTELIPALLENLATIADTELPSMVRILVAEAYAFPDLARVWREEVVSKILDRLTGAVERAQLKGEIRPGNPRLHAFTIFGPLIAAIMFKEVLHSSDKLTPDLRELAAQHAENCIHGLVQQHQTLACDAAAR